MEESAKLLADYVDGKNEAATEIYNKYVLRLIALASARIAPKLNARFDAEDVVQSAYRSFFRKAKDEEIVLHRSGDLWRVLATFTCLKTLKRIEQETGQKNHPDREVRGEEWVQSICQSEPTAVEISCVVDQLQHYMQQLSARDRIILELRLQGESVSEIADQLKLHVRESGEYVHEVKEATIRRVLRNAKQELRTKLMLD